MTAQQWVGLGVRLFAIWLLYLTFQSVVAIPMALAGSGMEQRAWLAYVIGALYFLVAIALWVFPMTVAHRVVPRTRDNQSLKTSAFDAARVGVALLGLWLLIQAVPSLVLFLLNTFLFAGSGSIFGAMSAEGRIQIVVHALNAAVALVLLLRAEAVARFILRPSREAEVAATSQTAPDVE
jgi:hypothetical protein